MSSAAIPPRASVGGGIISGIPGHAIEDIKIHDVYLESIGASTKEMAALQPPESIRDDPWPDPDMFGDIPASGFFLRHIRNIEFTNVEIAFTRPDARPVFCKRLTNPPINGR